MQALIAHINTWLFNIQLLQIVLLVLIVGWLVFVMYQWLTKKQLTRNYRSLKQQLEHDLQGLSQLYGEQSQKASYLLQQYNNNKGNQLPGHSLISSGHDVLAAVAPRVYFSSYQSLLADSQAPRFVTILMDVFHELRMSWQQLQQMQDAFPPAYEEAHKTYYNNIADLVKLNEELKEYVRGKTLNRQSADWVQGYFSIFDQWLRHGASKEMSVLQQQIVLKVPELNQGQPGSPFGSKTNEKAHQCIKAFETIAQLDDTYINKLQQYRRSNTRAARIMALLSGEPMAGVAPLTLHPATAEKAGVFGKKEKLFAGAALLLLAVGCFLGGRYTGHRSHTVLAGNTTPEMLQKDSAVRQQRVDSLPIKPAGPVLPPDSMATVCGMDISKYQGDLLKELPRLDNLHFVICKATQGTTMVDVEFKYNWQRLQQLQLVRGAYHFFMGNDDPVQQAQHFLKTVGVLAKNDIPLIIDIEEGSLTAGINKNKLQHDLLRCLQYLHQHSGRKPVIYTDLSFANTYLQQAALANYPLWLAEYSRRAVPVLPDTWKEKGIVFWQKNDTLTVHSHKTDFDVFIGNGNEFVKFLTPHPN